MIHFKRVCVTSVIVATFLGASIATAAPGGIPGPPAGNAPGVGLPQCQANVAICTTDLGACEAELTECEEQPPAPVAQTGQEDCFTPNGGGIPCAGTGQDGEIQAGVVSPSPRFTDNQDGTVTDNLTGLIWLKDWGCLGLLTWPEAVSGANELSDANPQGCNLTDGSVAGDWRLPNVKELYSLVDAQFVPTLSNTAGPGPWTDGDPFTNVWMAFPPGAIYWSSTTSLASPDKAWLVSFSTASNPLRDKPGKISAVAVRGGTF